MGACGRRGISSALIPDISGPGREGSRGGVGAKDQQDAFGRRSTRVTPAISYHFPRVKKNKGAKSSGFQRCGILPVGPRGSLGPFTLGRCSTGPHVGSCDAGPQTLPTAGSNKSRQKISFRSELEEGGESVFLFVLVMPPGVGWTNVSWHGDLHVYPA